MVEISLTGASGPPSASQRCLTAPLGPTAIAHSDIAAGFSSSVTSQVAGPSGSISHTAVAVDPVYGSQFTGLASIDNTQADWQAGLPSQMATGPPVWGSFVLAWLQRP